MSGPLRRGPTGPVKPIHMLPLKKRPELIGRSIRRGDGEGKVTGETNFGGDLAGPDVLTLGVIRSPHPHCEIETLDLEPARAIDGVVAILTQDDIRGTNRHGLIRRDQEVFATRCRFRGDCLGVVVGVTPKIVERALEAIRIEYKELPIIATREEALAEGAFPIHAEGNVLTTGLIRKGDAEEALAAPDVVTVTTVTETQCVDHAFLDREAGMAYVDDDDVVTIYASGQWVHEERRLVALALGLPQERVRIIQPMTGGAFGGREDISIQIYLGLAALRLRRPVRIEYTREESMLARHKRHPIRIEYTLGADGDGRFVAAKVMIYSDEGAYASTGAAVLRKSVSHCTGPYRVPNVHCDGVAFFTNNNPTGAMRGFGACQLAIAYEATVVELARALSIDVVDLKRLNLLDDGEGVTTDQRIPVVGVRDCMEAALRRINWDERSYETPAPHLRRGYGVSTICFGIGYGDGFPDASRARVRVAEDGVVEVYTGGVDFGQGLHSLAAQITARELGVDPHSVRVIASDTHTTPEAGSSSATRQTIFTGNAVRLAASEVAQQLRDIAAAYTGLHWDDLELRDNVIAGEHDVAGNDDRTVVLPFSQAVRLGRERGFSLDVESCYKPRTVRGAASTGKSPRAFITYMFASHVAEVLVDLETGEVKVERIVAAHDVGKAINPQQVEGQIEGGVVQGLGMALMEEVVSEKGEMLNASFTDYIIPTIVDTPNIEALIIERDDPEGPYGARGVGEPGLIGTPPAVLGAIADAIGTRVSTTPANAERVWQAIQRKAERDQAAGSSGDGIAPSPSRA